VANRTKLTAKKRQLFLEVLAKTGNVSQAAEAIGVRRQTAYEHRAADPEFAKAWEAALEIAADALEAEAWRRAVDGVDEPVGWFKGEAGGTVRKYSDTLLIFLLKGARPHKYRETIRQEIANAPGESLAIGVTFVDYRTGLAAAESGSAPDRDASREE
jgi:hypothetical protein